MNEDLSVLSPLTARGLSESLARMNLIDADETPAFELLAGGVSSLIVRAMTSRGLLCVKRALPKLKVAADWFAPVERNTAEVHWMKQAATVFPECVPRLLGEDPEGFTFAMEFLNPETYRNWKALLSDGVVDLAFARTLGLRLARIHSSTAGKSNLARLFNTDAAFSSLRLDAYYAATAQVHLDCAPALHNLIETTRRMKLVAIHGDVSPKNILEGPEGPVFLDAETAWYGDPAFDLAFCLNHLLLKSIWRPQWTDEYLQAFMAVAESYLASVAWEAPAALEARACGLLAGNLLSRVDGKSPVEYVTEDGDKNFIRRFSKELLLHPETSLRSMAERWRKDRRNEM